VLVTWLPAPADYRRTLAAALALGGDTDTVGAIAGALAGATAGCGAIPADLIGGLADWPLSTARLRGVAVRLARHLDGEAVRPEPLPARVLAPLRNLVMTAVVLVHLGRRLLPPY